MYLHRGGSHRGGGGEWEWEGGCRHGVSHERPQLQVPCKKGIADKLSNKLINIVYLLSIIYYHTTIIQLSWPSFYVVLAQKKGEKNGNQFHNELQSICKLLLTCW